MTCIYGATSPHGITWTSIAKPLFVHKSETDTTVLYDEWLGGYVMYTRLYPAERRVVAICEAEDFRRWGPVRPLIWPGLDDPQSTDIYHTVRTQPPGMPKVKLMFPMFYDRFDQTSSSRLFTSIDGLHWSQVPGGPVLSRKSFADSSIEHPVLKKPLLPLPHDREGLRYTAARYPEARRLRSDRRRRPRASRPLEGQRRRRGLPIGESVALTFHLRRAELFGFEWV